MLTCNPSYGTSYVHVESGSEGMVASVVARLLQLPCFFFHFVETGLGGLCLRRSCQTLMALMLRRLPRVDVPMDMSPSCTSHTQGQLPLLKLGPAHREEQCYRH